MLQTRQNVVETKYKIHTHAHQKCISNTQYIEVFNARVCDYYCNYYLHVVLGVWCVYWDVAAAAAAVKHHQ